MQHGRGATPLCGGEPRRLLIAPPPPLAVPPPCCALQALQRADQIEYAEGKVTRDYFLPIVADAGECAAGHTARASARQQLKLGAAGWCARSPAGAAPSA